MLCAYNSSEHGRRYVSDRGELSRVTLTGALQLEGHELSYLRAIGVFLVNFKWDSRRFTFGCTLGVIILSAVLKRRMTLADKAKSLFISK
jgi:hypothetical protein